MNVRIFMHIMLYNIRFQIHTRSSIARYVDAELVCEQGIRTWKGEKRRGGLGKRRKMRSRTARARARPLAPGARD